MTIRSIGRCSDYKSFVSLLLSHLRHPKGNEDWPASNVISSRAALGIVETWMVWSQLLTSLWLGECRKTRSRTAAKKGDGGGCYQSEHEKGETRRRSLRTCFVQTETTPGLNPSSSDLLYPSTRLDLSGDLNRLYHSERRGTLNCPDPPSFGTWRCIAYC